MRNERGRYLIGRELGSRRNDISHWQGERTISFPANDAADDQSGNRYNLRPASTGWRVWEILRVRKLGFIALSCLGLILGVATAVFQTPLYQATTAMEIEDLNDDFLSTKKVSPLQESGAIDTLTDIQTRVKALQSEGLLRRALPQVVRQAAEIDSWRPTRSGWRKLGNTPAPTEWEQLSPEVLARSIKVRVVPMTRDIELLVSSANPRFAAVLANEICREFVQENIEARSNMSRQTGEWLDGLVKETRSKLEHSEAALQAYASSAGLVFNSEHKNISDDKLRQTQEELSRARADKVAKQSLFELASRSSTEALPQILDDRKLADYETRLTDLRRQQAELSTTYTAGYSKLKRLEAESLELEKAIHAESSAVVQRVGNEYWAAARRESLLEADYQSQSHSVSLDAEKAIQYNVLQREVDGNRQAYDALLQRAQEATVAAGMRESNIRLLDPALPPHRPYKPSLILNSGIGLFFGMFLGTIWVFAREGSDSSIRQPGDGTELLNLAELGVILHADAGSNLSPGRNDLMSIGPKSQGATENQPLSPTVSVLELADSFRGVLTSLLFSMREREGARIFALTSASEGEGKTTVTANLGLALAEVSSQVLLIDGDSCRGGLSQIFRVSGKQGLVELLQSSPHENALNFIQPTGVRGLSILSSGCSSPALSRLLHSNRFPRILAELRDKFDVILIDTPPVFAVPDARILGRASDGVILLMRAGRTTRQAALAAYHRLSADGTTLVGTVLNDWNRKGSESYYGYRYSKHYGAKRKEGGERTSIDIESNEPAKNGFDSADHPLAG